ncbi:hypothetical protein P7C71_g2005, partial [Lecanoromycetidae sp. Uapishka_2]
MDPLSITTSIIAVVGAGSKTAKICGKVVALRHAPEILLSLNSEMLDFECVISELRDVLSRYVETADVAPPKSLCQALEASQETVLKLEQLISYELTTVKGKANEVQLDRSVWLRIEPKVIRLKDKIRENKARLASASSLLAASEIDATDAMGRTLLSWAASQGDLGVVEELLLRGANPDLRAISNGWTPVHWATWSGDSHCVQMLIAAKADIHARDREGTTPFCRAATAHLPNIMRVLLAAGADVGSHDTEGNTALHTAAFWGRIENTAFLLQSGANVNACTKLGTTAIDLAVQENRHEVVELLISRCCVMISSNHLLTVAWQFADLESLRILASGRIDKVDLEATFVGDPAIEWAEWRRDFNTAWTRSSFQPPDEDPVKWYATFMEFVNSIIMARQDAENGQSRYGYVEELSWSCDEDSDEAPSEYLEGDDDEVWVDAPELPWD